MRYVSSLCLKEGMFLGKSIYGKGGELLLRQGQKLHDSYIKKIIHMGIHGVYVLDSISEDILIQNMISDEIRMEAVQTVREVFEKSENQRGYDQIIAKTQSLVENIVDEVFVNRDLMVNMIDLRLYDEYTFYHSVNVAVMSIAIATQMKYSRPELCRLGLGALLHDVGKIFISKQILKKSGKLTEKEYRNIQEHSTLGYDYLVHRFDIPNDSSLAVLEHHEKYDGSGYPNGLSTDAIVPFGRVISVADVYDALTSDRPYRKAMLPSEAMEYVMGGSGYLFDPNIVYQFTKKVAAYPVGTCVKMSNGMIGIVVENYQDCNTRPKVKLLKPKPERTTFINLRDDPSAKNITIVGIANM